jgi:actin-related protein
MFDGNYSAKPICLPTITSGQQFTEKIKSNIPQQLTDDEIRKLKLQCEIDIPECVFELPDGNKIALQENVIANQLFEKDRLHHIVEDYIQQSDEFVREYLYSTIMLVGGNTMWKGFASKLKSELQEIERRALLCHPYDVRVVPDPERMNAVWIGGSIVASLSAYGSLFVTKQEYEEIGSLRIVRYMEQKLQGL